MVHFSTVFKSLERYHVGSALVPSLAFAAVPTLPVFCPDEVSDSPKFMSSLPEDESAERSDSFYRPAMSQEEKEAFYRPIVRPTAREGKRSDRKAHVRCSSSDTVLESHSHGSRAARTHRKKSGGRSKSESRRHHACRHRRAKNDRYGRTDANWNQEQMQAQSNSQDSSHVSQQHTTVTDSGYQQGPTEESNFLKQQWTEMETLSTQYCNLEAERNALQDALADALTQLRDTQAGTAELMSLRKENRQLQEDVLLLKNTVYRLNAELEKYQNRLRALRKATEAAGVQVPESPSVEPSIKPTPMASNMLGPLLEAYQETILEKDSALDTSRRDLAAYAQRCDEARQEVQELRRQLKEAHQKNEELVDVERELHAAHQRSETLLQSLEAERANIQDLQKRHQQDVTALDGRARELEGKLNNCRTELLTLRGRYSVLAEQYEKLQEGADRLIPMSAHTVAVNECKRLFEELKTQYELERERFARKIASLEADRPRLEAQLETHTVSHTSLEATNRALEKMLKHCQAKNEDLCARLVSAHVSRDSAKRQLQRALTLVRELVTEQERLVRALQERQQESQSVARLGNTLVSRVGSLKAQLEDVQRGAYQELGTVEKLMKERAEGASRAEQLHQQEVQSLRALLRKKDQFIARLQRDKTKTEESLEIVWKAATSENPVLKERLTTKRPEGDSGGNISHIQEINSE